MYIVQFFDFLSYLNDLKKNNFTNKKNKQQIFQVDSTVQVHRIQLWDRGHVRAMGKYSVIEKRLSKIEL